MVHVAPCFIKHIKMKKIYFIFLSIGFFFTATAQDLSSTMTVKEGAIVYVSQGASLFSASEVNLKSTSDSFSSLFLDGPLGESTIVNYDRYVNKIGVSTMSGGNDIVSLPVKTDGIATFGDFLNYSDGIVKNSAVIPHSLIINTLYAFGPYNNTSGSYTNYNLATDGAVALKRGKGYRAASASGQTIRFTGKVSTSEETVEITTNNRDNWNTVGNPFPTYISSHKFLDKNLSVLNPNAAAIYGYNSATNGQGAGTIGNFTIINKNTSGNINIAPGQGFLVSNNPVKPTNQIIFNQDMRTVVGSDDFILGRNDNQNHKLRLRAAHETGDFATEFYFNSNSTLGLDPGYDAIIFGGTSYDFMFYSQLVEGSVGQKMAIQSLGVADFKDISISLGLKSSQGKKITFTIEESTLPSDIQVYLEDRQANIFTLLNTGTYTFIAPTANSETGRFFLKLECKSLSNIDEEIESLHIFTSEQSIFINGQLLAETNVSIYDIQGRPVLNCQFKQGSETNTIDTSTFSSGIYVIKLNNSEQYQTKKVIIN